MLLRFSAIMFFILIACSPSLAAQTFSSSAPHQKQLHEKHDAEGKSMLSAMDPSALLPTGSALLAGSVATGAYSTFPALRALLPGRTMWMTFFASAMAYGAYRIWHSHENTLLLSQGQNPDFISQPSQAEQRDSTQESASGSSDPHDFPPIVDLDIGEQETIQGFGEADEGTYSGDFVPAEALLSQITAAENYIAQLAELYDKITSQEYAGKSLPQGVQERQDQIHDLAIAMLSMSHGVKLFLENNTSEGGATQSAAHTVLHAADLVKKNLQIALVDTKHRYPILSEHHIVFSTALNPTTDPGSSNQEMQNQLSDTYFRKAIEEHFSPLEQHLPASGVFFGASEKNSASDIRSYLKKIKLQLGRLNAVKTSDQYRAHGQKPPHYQHFIERHMANIHTMHHHLMKTADFSETSPPHNIHLLAAHYKLIHQSVNLTLNLPQIIADAQTILEVNLEKLDDSSSD